jgi:RNA12 protein
MPHVFYSSQSTSPAANITFLYGFQGSGKSKMLSRVHGTYHCCISLAYSALVGLIRTSQVLMIDCAELPRANSDTQLIEALSRQTGYWPIFTFLNSMNNVIDLASVGLIGQKGMLSEKRKWFHWNTRVHLHRCNSWPQRFTSEPGQTNSRSRWSRTPCCLLCSL